MSAPAVILIHKTRGVQPRLFYVGQRRRRWSNMTTTLAQHIFFVGNTDTDKDIADGCLV